MEPPRDAGHLYTESLHLHNPLATNGNKTIGKRGKVVKKHFRVMVIGSTAIIRYVNG